MEYISVKNLDKYQHYKDRNIIWIKWHLESLDDYVFCKLDPASKWYFVGLICLACKTHNKIPKDFEYISKRLGGTSKTAEYSYTQLCAINLLSTCYQDGTKCLPRIDIDKIREDKNRYRKEEIISDKPKTEPLKESQKESEKEKPYQIPIDPLGKLVVAWKILQGFDMRDRGWDKAHWGRVAKSASILLDFFGGDHRVAGDCMSEIKRKMDGLRRSCTIETIVKHSAEWKIKNEKEGNYEQTGSRN